jgi:hypothetical protein
MYAFIEGDVYDTLPGFDADSFDACLCDPPYGLKFMGKKWDHGVPSVECWREVYRILKPGAVLLAFGGTRTVHRLTCAIEDAGFEIRDTLCWLYGGGFPKSRDISKGIDKAAGVERDVIGYKEGRAASPKHDFRGGHHHAGNSALGVTGMFNKITAPATPESALWSGYGTALKPAYEPIVLAMKPLDGTYTENAMRYGVAGLNIDECRIGTDVITTAAKDHNASPQTHLGKTGFAGCEESRHTGRWPANLLLSHSEQCVEGTDSIYVCADDCPVRLLDKQSGNRPGMPLTAKRKGVSPKGYGIGVRMPNDASMSPGYGDSGGASRFFYSAKVSTRERNLGGIDCRHPTLKPLSLCQYLSTLILPPAHPDGTPRSLLTPFSGAGSEVLGALLAGWDSVIGIEQDPEYVAWAEARVAAGLADPGRWATKAAKRIKPIDVATLNERADDDT